MFKRISKRQALIQAPISHRPSTITSDSYSVFLQLINLYFKSNYIYSDIAYPYSKTIQYPNFKSCKTFKIKNQWYMWDETEYILKGIYTKEFIDWVKENNLTNKPMDEILILWELTREEK